MSSASGCAIRGMRLRLQCAGWPRAQVLSLRGATHGWCSPGSTIETLRASPAPVVQPDDGVTYASKIDKSEARLDFTAAAVAVERAVRAFNPAPGAWCEIAGERVKLLRAAVIDVAGPVGVVLDDRLTIACADAAIRPTLLQRAGKPAMTAADALRGWSVPVGTRVG